MWIGVNEIAFLVAIALFVLVAVFVTKGQWKWLAGLPISVAAAMLVTPSDTMSTFLVAAPLAVGYTCLCRNRELRSSRQREST